MFRKVACNFIGLPLSLLSSLRTMGSVLSFEMNNLSSHLPRTSSVDGWIIL